MGRAKQAMMEDEEFEWEETPASFTCPECGKLSDSCIEVPKILDHNEYEFNVSIDVGCICCDERFNAEFSKEAHGCCKIRFDDYPEALVEFDPVYFEHDDVYDELFFYDQPDEPFLIWRSLTRLTR